MLKTTKQLVNEEIIIKILQDIIEKSYEEINGEEILLCLECSDVDLEVATSNHFEFHHAIKENFELDEFGEILDYDDYRKLMYELYDEFIDMHINSGLFDFFPEGEYEVEGKKIVSDSDIIAPRGKFYAPFEQALLSNLDQS
ncbi:hypothetical protein JMM81_14835 [Bacillus sp. V3B]|uniref:hypothetical protein n=1 Tax=Bacillus sp. V3B TaxID=2804915 RepID=UPI00210CF97F|nr:hypothetical protein [Bacillus sp. V3B]MCQ6276202.1 hypothetical protein [Bacillus sp. V3B]